MVYFQTKNYIKHKNCGEPPAPAQWPGNVQQLQEELRENATVSLV